MGKGSTRRFRFRAASEPTLVARNPKRGSLSVSLSLGVSVCLLLAIASSSHAAKKAVEPPLVGQPEHFSGAVGRFHIEARASSRDLRAEDTLVLNLQIHCVGPLGEAPKRPDLRSLPRFKSRFVIQDLSKQDLSGPVPGGYRWEYYYSLKPRGPEVTEVPPLLFVYYKPGVVPAEKGYWTTATRSIPLKVHPRGRATLVDSEGRPLRAPESMYHLVEGGAALGRHRFISSLGVWQIAALVLLPPLACLCWYFVWRRFYPDAARLAQIRYSRAAQLALQTLQASAASDTAFRAVESYLRNRLGIVIATPTPDEMFDHLRQCGLSEEVAGKVAEFFRACDAARFAPVPASTNLAAAAESVILALETETCSHPL
jgi:hypothetical protein